VMLGVTPDGGRPKCDRHDRQRCNSHRVRGTLP
jgi:hypothetical protein